MSDVVYRENPTANPEPPPSAEPMRLEEQRSSDRAFTPEGLAEVSEYTSENRLSERDWHDFGARELRKQRERDGGFDSADETRVVPVEAAKRDEPYSLKEAARELSEGHRKSWLANSLRTARAVVGNYRPVSDEDVARYDRNLTEAGLTYKPSEQGETQMGLMTDGGREIPKLRDDQRVTADLELTPRQAAKLTGNWREWQERAQNELVETLRGEEAKRQVVEAAQQLRQQPAPRPAQPAPQQQPQLQVDPVAAAQRQHLAAQQAALNLSAEQKAIVERSAEWQRWASKIPELQSWAAFNYTKQHDPARHAQVVKALQAGKQFNDVARQRFGELNEIRHSRAQRWAQAQGAQHAQYQRAVAAQREALNEKWDNESNAWLNEAMPWDVK